MKYGLYIDLNRLKFPRRIIYVIDFINAHPMLPKDISFYICDNKDEAHIIYSNIPSTTKPSIFRTGFLFNEKLPNKFNCTKHLIFGNEYYAIGNSDQNRHLTAFSIPFDLFETIFFFISRIEEKHRPFEKYLGKKEEYDNAFLAIKENIQQIPIVDHLVGLLVELIMGALPQVPTTYSMSHDIDEVRKFKNWYSTIKKTGGQIFHRKNISRLPLIWAQALKAGKEDPFDTSQWMLLSEKNINKEIYFLCGGNHRWDTPYSLDDKIFRNFVKSALAYNYKIGIHPSYLSWNNVQMIKDEKEKLELNLGQEVQISRQHFLNFDVSITPYLLSEIGIKKDSSLGFSRHIGFRSGTGCNHKLYDFEREKATELVESPLAFMDVACLYEADWKIEKYISLKNAFFEKNKYNTHINLLYHNTTFDEMEMSGQPMRAYYLKFNENE